MKKIIGYKVLEVSNKLGVKHSLVVKENVLLRSRSVDRFMRDITTYAFNNEQTEFIAKNKRINKFGILNKKDNSKLYIAEPVIYDNIHRFYLANKKGNVTVLATNNKIKFLLSLENMPDKQELVLPYDSLIHIVKKDSIKSEFNTNLSEFYEKQGIVIVFKNKYKFIRFGTPVVQEIGKEDCFNLFKSVSHSKKTITKNTSSFDMTKKLIITSYDYAKQNKMESAVCKLAENFSVDMHVAKKS